ncbi:MAG TPA: sulfur carrier protein ThiS [Candidatus Polarisedimenticolia bacterium]|nr:sulfur carrier protein ThiS [Candidatus Polarisedimenticolia bacterium]
MNGSVAEAPEGATLESLIGRLGLPTGRIAVERNGEVVPRGQYAGVVLAEGDVLEVVTLVGGG